ncbi:MAG: 50S ribosomal protein L5 [Candidatus Kaiserbacteria bacterium]|nr:50S ribosomal protein L5 [Candidatus Kaiserbacteria bacterium]
MKTQTQQQKTFEALKTAFHYKSVMQAPKVSKIVVSTGVGAKHDPKKRAFIKDRLTRITGQAPAARTAKKSIATFKMRAGDEVGFQVTLRGARSEAFLNKLIHIVLPRSKDFRGIKPETIDEMGNITIGFKENIVFPETADEDSKDIFGLAVTIVTTAKNKREAEAFLRYLGLPLKDAEAKK